MKKVILFAATVLIFISCSTTQSNQSAASDMMSAKKGLFKDDFGVQTWSFRNYFPKDMIGTLDKLQEMGITKVEGYTIYRSKL